MENLGPLEPLSRCSLAKRAAGTFIAGMRFVGNQLAVADLNPHEGRLRGSITPSEYIQVPDHPPVHDDNI
jgi:hypothetical protein